MNRSMLPAVILFAGVAWGACAQELSVDKSTHLATGEQSIATSKSTDQLQFNDTDVYLSNSGSKDNRFVVGVTTKFNNLFREISAEVNASAPTTRTEKNYDTSVAFSSPFGQGIGEKKSQILVKPFLRHTSTFTQEVGQTSTYETRSAGADAQFQHYFAGTYADVYDNTLHSLRITLTGASERTDLAFGNAFDRYNINRAPALIEYQFEHANQMDYYQASLGFGKNILPYIYSTDSSGYQKDRVGANAGPEYQKAVFYGFVRKGINDDVRAEGVVRGQFTKDILINSETTGLGGFGYVRGMRDDVVTADSAVTGEFNLINRIVYKDDLEIEPLIFFDAGAAKRNSAAVDTLTYFSAYSVGLGLNVKFSSFYIESSIGHLIDGSVQHQFSDNGIHAYVKCGMKF